MLALLGSSQIETEERDQLLMMEHVSQMGLDGELIVDIWS